MPDQPGRFTWTAKFAGVALVASLGVLGLALAGSAAFTVGNLLQQWSWRALAVGVLMALAALLAGIWLVVIYGLIRLMQANEDAVSRTAGRLNRIESLLGDEAQSGRELIRLARLSDRTKGLIYRDQELEAIRDSFQDALVRQDYDAAEATIQGAAEMSGYAAEADRMREELDESRKATAEEKLDAAVQRVHQIMERKDWPRALGAAQRLVQMFPDNPKVSVLPEKLQAAKTKHKRQLLQAYGEAVRKNDIDGGVALLKQLDAYLTPQEGAALEESARGVFRARLHNLGVQFALCVTDERWAEAVAVGEVIVKEYPNSRMATEVGEKMERLRAHAIASPAQAPQT